MRRIVICITMLMFAGAATAQQNPPPGTTDVFPSRPVRLVIHGRPVRQPI
jgi:hypothetical protein